MRLINFTLFISTLLTTPISAGVDDRFEWFRCDSCRATFHQVKEKVDDLVRKKKFEKTPIYEFIEILDDICENSFTKEKYGVKQHENRSYLFGPGIVDHLGPNEGFGQMGMGDYDDRLKSFCHGFIEDVGEENLKKMGPKIDKEGLCREECLTPASGTKMTKRGRNKLEDDKRKLAEKAKMEYTESLSNPKKDYDEADRKKERDSLEKKAHMEQFSVENAVKQDKEREEKRKKQAGKTSKKSTVAPITSNSMQPSAALQAAMQFIPQLDADGLREVGDQVMHRLWEMSNKRDAEPASVRREEL